MNFERAVKADVFRPDGQVATFEGQNSRAKCCGAGFALHSIDLGWGTQRLRVLSG